MAIFRGTDLFVANIQAAKNMRRTEFGTKTISAFDTRDKPEKVIIDPRANACAAPEHGHVAHGPLIRKVYA